MLRSKRGSVSGLNTVHLAITTGPPVTLQWNYPPKITCDREKPSDPSSQAERGPNISHSNWQLHASTWYVCRTVCVHEACQRTLNIWIWTQFWATVVTMWCLTHTRKQQLVRWMKNVEKTAFLTSRSAGQLFPTENKYYKSYCTEYKCVQPMWEVPDLDTHVSPLFRDSSRTTLWQMLHLETQEFKTSRSLHYHWDNER